MLSYDDEARPLIGPIGLPLVRTKQDRLTEACPIYLIENLTVFLLGISLWSKAMGKAKLLRLQG